MRAAAGVGVGVGVGVGDGPGTPVPLSVTLGDTNSLTISVAVRTPVTGGLKMTLIVQLPPGASVAGQLLVCRKLLALAPPVLIPVIANDPVPALESVTGREALCVPTV